MAKKISHEGFEGAPLPLPPRKTPSTPKTPPKKAPDKKPNDKPKK